MRAGGLVAGAALAVAVGCSSPGGSSEAAGDDPVVTTTSTSTTSVVAPPTTGEGGTMGIPPARSILSLGIPGVTSRPIPGRCAVEIVANNSALGFAVNSDAIPEQGMQTLRAIAAELEGAVSVALAGHSSTEGLRARNVELAELRVNAVHRVLEPLIPGATFSVDSYGPDRPRRVPEATEADREENRRVEIVAEVPAEVCETFEL